MPAIVFILLAGISLRSVISSLVVSAVLSAGELIDQPGRRWAPKLSEGEALPQQFVLLASPAGERLG